MARRYFHRYTGSLADYLESKSMPEPNSGCWLWLDGYGSHGYGQTKLKGKYLLGHRLSWLAHKGPVPRGLQVLHRCDNRACINPAHLFLGTHGDNHADKVTKGRQARGSTNARAKITEEAARAIYSAAGKQQDIARRYGISRPTVSLIKSGKIWGHVTG